MSFVIIYHQKVIEKDIPALSKPMQVKIKVAIENRLSTKPANYGKPLRYSMKSLWTLRVGDYRVIYRIEHDKVIILKIGHRKEVYKKML